MEAGNVGGIDALRIETVLWDGVRKILFCAHLPELDGFWRMVQCPCISDLEVAAVSERSGRKVYSEWLVRLFGVVILLVGLTFVVMGGELAALGGSTYYVICGVILAASGVLTILGRTLGAYLYLVALAYTWIWSLWEVGFSPVDLLPRAFGPTILGIIAILTIPVLRRMNHRRHVRGTV